MLPSEEISIRQATAVDTELLSTLGAQTFSDTFGPDNTPEDLAAYLAASFSPIQIASELSDPQAVFFIAELHGQTVGYAKILSGHTPPEVTAPNPIELVRIYSTREFLGRGVGAALMQACLRHAADLGFATIWLGVWERNLRAQAFYRKWGFSVAGTHSFLLGADLQTDYIMQRPLEGL